MSTTATKSGRGILFVVMTVLALASIPVVKVQAQGASVIPTPPVPGSLRGQRLELLWHRQLSIHDSMAYALDHAGQRIAMGQQLIDRAQANGRDVTAVQAALDALAAAIRQAQPIFESSSEIITTHQGFDADGNVLDPLLAAQTIRALSEKLRMARGPVADARIALQAAVQDLRHTYQRVPAALATPSA